MAKKRFGHIDGVSVGQEFESRAALAAAGVHPPTMPGIHGTKKDGADSIVVSGGYVDDVDLGDVIIYTGAGGNDSNTGRQVADQSLEHPNNAGLVTSQLAGLPVRVSRGRHRGSAHAPAAGYRYEGLFAVVDHWVDVGRDGYKIVRFRLEKLSDGAPAEGPDPHSDTPAYATTTVTRRIRDSAAARWVKEAHGHACQICGVVIPVDGGRNYAEGAHIRPLGVPHDGPDDTGNLLCLCPNHHAQFDHGGLAITPDFDVVERGSGRSIGRLRTVPRHRIGVEHFEYRLAHMHGRTVQESAPGVSASAAR
ncbi:hypothetical protein CGZ94_20240 [Enemella evansiae]|uniref:YDG domain-containing protein n=2 Tax=Enemella evansiae TaxID=2016499 RepID=A0A255FYW3_9ACTN|nr:hypothetical protein CGZ94_20240 [Enemella evansiae]